MINDCLTFTQFVFAFIIYDLKKLLHKQSLQCYDNNTNE